MKKKRRKPCDHSASILIKYRPWNHPSVFNQQHASIKTTATSTTTKNAVSVINSCIKKHLLTGICFGYWHLLHLNFLDMFHFCIRGAVASNTTRSASHKTSLPVLQTILLRVSFSTPNSTWALDQWLSEVQNNDWNCIWKSSCSLRLLGAQGNVQC